MWKTNMYNFNHLYASENFMLPYKTVYVPTRNLMFKKKKSYEDP